MTNLASEARRSHVTRFVLPLLLSVAVVTAVCSSQRGPSPSALRLSEEGRTEATNAATLGVAEVATATALIAERPVRLVKASLLKADAPVRLVGARVSFVASATRTVYRGMPGFFCSYWPPTRYGPNPSYALEGLEIYRGDVFAVTLILLADRVGDWTAQGVRVEYDDDGKRRSISDDRLTIHLVRRELASQLPGGKSACNDPSRAYGWWAA